jgi:hypothetical protein
MPAMADPVRLPYERYPYPRISLLATVRRCDTYALNLESFWARCNGELLQPGEGEDSAGWPMRSSTPRPEPTGSTNCWRW